MDSINNIIDFHEIMRLSVFIIGGFVLLWIGGKVNKYLIAKKRKEWKRKKKKI